MEKLLLNIPIGVAVLFNVMEKSTLFFLSPEVPVKKSVVSLPVVEICIMLVSTVPLYTIPSIWHCQLLLMGETGMVSDEMVSFLHELITGLKSIKRIKPVNKRVFIVSLCCRLLVYMA